MFEQLESSWEGDLSRTEAESLLYRSNLLGSNKTITNFGGGNTSAKVSTSDPLAIENVPVLWVKGSGGDLGSMDSSGFATLYLDKLLSLESLHGSGTVEDDIVQLLPHCIFNQNPRAPSIDTNLHAYLPFTHIDHMHPDAVIAIATAEDGEAQCRKIFAGRIGWLAWKRPGLELALQLRDLVKSDESLEGVILQNHGLFTWGESSEGCYDNTINTINQAIEAVNTALRNNPPYTTQCSEAKDSKDLQIQLAPILRASVSLDQSKIGYFNHSDRVMAFVNSKQCRELSKLGTSCPDHFLRTKIWPLVIDAKDILDDSTLEAALEQYRENYKRYYDECRHDNSPSIRDSNPVIVLVPGLGMFGFAATRTVARIATEFYENAINVMAGAQALSRYTSLPEQEAFDIEYWPLEEAKLKRLPPALHLTGRVALVTGAAGGIGGTVARQFLANGACVICCDNNRERLDRIGDELRQDFAAEMILCIEMDVTSEANVQSAVAKGVGVFGGIDILVANAGIASAAAFEDTSLEVWNLNHNVLSLGYFLVSREVFKVMKQVGGGSMIFIGSKNALASSSGAAAYSTAKAASLHLARCLALEGAPHNIRVNTVNPDAVIEGSAIWSGEWRQQRADGYGIKVDELEAFYRDRSLLKVNVTPTDITRAVMFFATDESSRSTGNIINVDGGNATAFTR